MMPLKGMNRFFFSSQPESFSTQSADGEAVWYVDVNSDCTSSDYDIKANIEVDPKLIKDPKLLMTTYDVDYNDPQSCERNEINWSQT
jgi:hypothetical protein